MALLVVAAHCSTAAAGCRVGHGFSSVPSPSPSRWGPSTYWVSGSTGMFPGRGSTVDELVALELARERHLARLAVRVWQNGLAALVVARREALAAVRRWDARRLASPLRQRSLARRTGRIRRQPRQLAASRVERAGAGRALEAGVGLGPCVRRDKGCAAALGPAAPEQRRGPQQGRSPAQRAHPSTLPWEPPPLARVQAPALRPA